MNIQQNKKDDFIKTLIDNEGIQSPGSGFTQNILGKINELESLKSAKEKPSIPYFAWILAFAGIAFVVATLIILSNLGYVQILPDNFEFTLLPMFKSIILSFRDIFSSIDISSTSIAIIAGLSLLVIFERILKLTPIGKNNYFFTV